MSVESVFPQKRVTLIDFYHKYKEQLLIGLTGENTGKRIKSAESYITNYTEVLAPKFSDKTIDEYTPEDIRARMNEIKSTGTSRGGVNRPYANTTMDTLYSNLRKLFRIACEKGYCYSNPVIELDRLADTPLPSPETFTDEMIILRKSLSTKEEQRVYEQVFSDPDQAGEVMGVALMFAFGLRNSEACAVPFSSICEMEEHPGHYYLEINKSSDGNSGDTKDSGKTPNANRRIPMTQSTYEFITARRAFVENELSENTSFSSYTKEQITETVKDYPIACRRNELEKHSTPSLLSACGKKILNDARVDKNIFVYIEHDHSTSLLEEKEATAYLFRRNFATHLYVLGLHDDEIQYLMGHKIADSPNIRNFYTHEDKLFSIKQKMDKRPLFSNTKLPVIQMNLSSHNSELLESEAAYDVELSLPAKSKTYVQLNLNAREPKDTISIRMAAEDTVPIDVTLVDAPCHRPSGPVNILRGYIEEYDKVTEHEFLPEENDENAVGK